MAVDVTLTTITSGYNLTKLNANFTAISTALADCVSRSATSPNTMGADLDMNSNTLINLKEPTSNAEAATKLYVDTKITGNGTTPTPSNPGDDGKVLTASGGVYTWENLDATLEAIADVTFAADKFLYATGADTFTTGTMTSFGRSLVDDASATTARTTLGLGAASVEGVASGGSAGLLRADGDGSSLTGIVPSTTDQVARDNTILNALDILELQGGAVKALVNMVVDAFEDETGIDTATSTNETYDATGNYYTNVSTSQVQIAQGAGTVIGNLTGYGGNAVAFDGTTSGNFSGNTIAGASVATGYVGKDWGASVKKQVTGFKAWSDDSRGFDIGTTATTGTITATLYGSDNGSDWTSLGNDSKADTATSQNTFSKLTGLTAGFYRYHKLEFNAADGGPVGVAEVEFYENTISDMVLLTNAITASTAPAEIRVVVDHEDLVENVTVNTDLVAAVSRDGGTTWSNATLAEIRDAGSGRTVLAADVDVSGQPSGTSVKARITTANSKAQRVHKLALQADVTLTV